MRGEPVREDRGEASEEEMEFPVRRAVVEKSGDVEIEMIWGRKRKV